MIEELIRSLIKFDEVARGSHSVFLLLDVVEYSLSLLSPLRGHPCWVTFCLWMRRLLVFVKILAWVFVRIVSISLCPMNLIVLTVAQLVFHLCVSYKSLLQSIVNGHICRFNSFFLDSRNVGGFLLFQLLWCGRVRQTPFGDWTCAFWDIRSCSFGFLSLYIDQLSFRFVRVLLYLSKWFEWDSLTHCSGIIPCLFPVRGSRQAILVSLDHWLIMMPWAYLDWLLHSWGFKVLSVIYKALLLLIEIILQWYLRWWVVIAMRICACSMYHLG